MATDLKKDRTAFLEVVERYVGRATRDAFAVIVDDLIEWSEPASRWNLDPELGSRPP
jgi:hypothetical protein